MFNLFKCENLWGYKDGNGKIVIKPAFLRARNFRNGFAAVVFLHEKKWRFINSEGQDIFNLTFVSGTDFFMERAVLLVNDYKRYCEDPYDSDYFVTLNTNGQIEKASIYKLPISIFSICEFEILNNGWIYTHNSWKSGPKTVRCQTAIFNEEFKLIIRKEYGRNTSSVDYLYPIFNVSDFSNGLLKVIYDDRFEFIDKKGKVIFSILKTKYADIEDFHNGIARVKSENRKLYLLKLSTLKQETIIAGSNFSINNQQKRHFNNDRAIVNHQIINSLGNIVISKVEDYVFRSNEYRENDLFKESVVIHPNKFITEKKKNGDLIVYNEIGSIIFLESDANHVGFYSDGFLLIRVHRIIRNFNRNTSEETRINFYIDEIGKIHVLNNDNKIKYYPFSNGYALGSSIVEFYPRHGNADIKFFYFNIDFEITTTFFIEKYNLNSHLPFSQFSCNVAKIRWEGKITFINCRGESVLDVTHFNSTSDRFYNDVIWVNRNGYYGIIDKKGVIIFKTVAEFLVYCDDSMIILGNSLYGFINKKGICIEEPKYEWFESQKLKKKSEII